MDEQRGDDAKHKPLAATQQRSDPYVAEIMGDRKSHARGYMSRRLSVSNLVITNKNHWEQVGDPSPLIRRSADG
jgi:hypothetical protein